MIVITIIILYFIQIRHTDDFPSTGTRLVQLMHALPRVPELSGLRIVFMLIAICLL